MQKITPFLWFDGNAEEAMHYYTSIFKNSRIGDVSRYDKPAADATGQQEGSIMTATIYLEDQEFMLLNGGPHFKFTEAVSFYVDCKDQEEVDYFWDKLTADGGEESMCGWLKDKFGLSWQIIPSALAKMMSDPDQEKATRVMQAMLKMRKIIVQDLQDAYDGK